MAAILPPVDGAVEKLVARRADDEDRMADRRLDNVLQQRRGMSARPSGCRRPPNRSARCRSDIVSSQRRTAQKSSSMLNGSCDRPRIDASVRRPLDRTTRVASSSRPMSGPIVRADKPASVADSLDHRPERRAVAVREASAADDRRLIRTEATTSRMSRDLPTPASPMTVAIVGVPLVDCVRNWPLEQRAPPRVPRAAGARRARHRRIHRRPRAGDRPATRSPCP